MTRHNLAVYGTLKKGFGNHPVLGKGATLVGVGQTVNSHWMPDMGDGPPVVTKAPEVAPIHVEVYEVDDSQLTGPLDWLEANGVNYTREIIPIMIEEGKVVDAWLYFHNRPAEFWNRNKPIEVADPPAKFVWRDEYAA